MAPATSAAISSTGLSRSLTADVTVNTDFAQVEEDLQQINLTRFSILFPEKRDFFLEGPGDLRVRRPQPRRPRLGGDSDDVPIMFFSRQIGLANGQTIPVLAGGRVTGKAGPYDIAALNIETGAKSSADVNATNFSAVRLRRDILRRSNVGDHCHGAKAQWCRHQHGAGCRYQQVDDDQHLALAVAPVHGCPPVRLATISVKRASGTGGRGLKVAGFAHSGV